MEVKRPAMPSCNLLVHVYTELASARQDLVGFVIAAARRYLSGLQFVEKSLVRGSVLCPTATSTVAIGSAENLTASLLSVTESGSRIDGLSVRR